MKVFVAGASGAIGQPTVRALGAAGHEVTGMTRREERAAEIREAGAQAVVCDAFDAEGVREAVVAAAPEVVVHLLTALPERFGPKARPRRRPTGCGSRGRGTWSRRLRPPARSGWLPRASPFSTPPR